MKKLLTIILAFLLINSIIIQAEPENYDTVILNGNIYDPLAGVYLKNYNIGISSGKIKKITRDEINGSNVIDAKDKLVLPGFIDALSDAKNEEYNQLRLKDGVTTTVIKSDLPFDKYILQEENQISYINRILIYDFTPIFNPNASKEEKEKFESDLNERLDEGYAGLYFKPTPNSKFPNLKNIPVNYPIYLDFFEFEDSKIIPWLDKFKNDQKNDRKIYIVNSNFHFSSMDNIIGYSNEEENVFMGGYPFSYTNIVPSEISDEKFNKLINQISINQNEFNIFRLSAENKNMTDTLSVIGLIDEKIINKALNSNSFVSESFNHFDASRPSTAGINTFMGRLFLTFDKELPEQKDFYNTVFSQSTILRNIFGNRSFLQNKGCIETGADADLIIVNTENISQFSSMTEEIHPSTGIDSVIRNGYIIYDQGNYSTIAPKAYYLKDEIPSFIDESYTISTKGKKKRKFELLNYEGKHYLRAHELADYLNIKYEENGGTFYFGGIIRLEIGNRDFTIGTNKLSLKNSPHLIDGSYVIDINDLDDIFESYYNIEIGDETLNFSADKMSKLLDKKEDNGSSINVDLNPVSIFISYLMAAGLIFLFVFLLNKKRTKTKKGE
ncbi:hypothetical protein [Ezakiella coagulans]|uniref:hypothetical protein n=1 Tax=Ezakiella coagulans TaxID=46507 RepID=UPI002014F6A7|nr:hypothetical protein [Ezakiella coagulans]UQK60940.1 hypothetical protein M1R54_01190 [Ezakiella coagulans]